jgi:hypothetical protein
MLEPLMSRDQAHRDHLRRQSARVITDTDEALVLWLWWKRRRDVEFEDLSNYRWYAASTGQEPMGSNIGALSFETAGFLLGRLPRNILILRAADKIVAINGLNPERR